MRPIRAWLRLRCVLYSFSMGKRGQWSRWGRGMCEGWSLDLGKRLSRRRRAPGPLRAAGDMVGVGERRLPVPSHDLVVVRL